MKCCHSLLNIIFVLSYSVFCHREFCLCEIFKNIKKAVFTLILILLGMLESYTFIAIYHNKVSVLLFRGSLLVLNLPKYDVVDQGLSGSITVWFENIMFGIAEVTWSSEYFSGNLTNCSIKGKRHALRWNLFSLVTENINAMKISVLTVYQGFNINTYTDTQSPCTDGIWTVRRLLDLCAMNLFQILFCVLSHSSKLVWRISRI